MWPKVPDAKKPHSDKRGLIRKWPIGEAPIAQPKIRIGRITIDALGASLGSMNLFHHSYPGTPHKKITYFFIGLAFTTFLNTIPAKRKWGRRAWL